MSETCENCGKQIGDLETPHVFQGHIVCAECDARLRRHDPRRSVQPLQDPGKVTPARPAYSSRQMTCAQCGGRMKQSTLSKGTSQGIVLALGGFAIGLFTFVFLWWTIIGAVVGLLLMVFSLGVGGKRQKVWKCTSCGYFFERARTLGPFNLARVLEATGIGIGVLLGLLFILDAVRSTREAAGTNRNGQHPTTSRARTQESLKHTEVPSQETLLGRAQGESAPRRGQGTAPLRAEEETGLPRFSFLRKWKPYDLRNSMGAEVLLEERLTEQQLVAFVRKVADNHDPVIITIWTSRTAWEDEDAVTPDFKSGYILYYEKDSRRATEQIRWMQEIGEFSEKRGQVTNF